MAFTSKSERISPLDGEAFLHSRIKPAWGLSSVLVNAAYISLVVGTRPSMKLANGFAIFKASISMRLSSTICSKIFFSAEILILVVMLFFSLLVTCVG